jgi:3-oxoacyl-[acyl-carrier protein] reductase
MSMERTRRSHPAMADARGMATSSGRPLTGKTALVTGGGRGIGAAIGRRLAVDGAVVALNYLSDAAAAQELAAGIAQQGGEAFPVQADVSSMSGIRQLFETLDAELEDRRGSPALDILVNNAGVGRVGRPSDTPEDVFDLVFATDVKGPFFVTQAAIQRMPDGGRIISISSGRSKRPFAANAAYCMAKAAIDSHVVMLAAELGPRNITANALAPGWTVTDQSSEFLRAAENQNQIVERTALRRLGEPDDIAAVAAFLASDEGRWVTGQYVEASGGYDVAASR